MNLLSPRLVALHTELCDIFAGRNELGPAFPLMVDAWCGAMTRELTRLEFPPAEIEEMLEQRVRAAIRESKFTGVLPGGLMR